MTPRRSPLLSLGLLTALLLAAAPAPAVRALSLDALRQRGYGAVPLRIVGRNVLAVDAEINGRRTRLILDTGYGGQGILLQDSMIQELRLPADQVRPVSGVLTTAHGVKLGGFRGAKAERVRLGGGLELTGVPLFFTSVRGAFRGQGGRGEGDGYFGAPFLAACGAVIDLQNAVVYLHPPGPGAVTDVGPALRGVGMLESPFSYDGKQGFVIDTRLNGVDARMVVDTGAGLTCVNPAAIKGLRAAAWSSRMESVDASGNRQRGQAATLDELRIGGHAVRTTDIRFTKLGLGDGPDAPAGLLGADLLGRNGAIINCGTRKLYLIPPGR